jgi:hypothetical protein
MAFQFVGMGSWVPNPHRRCLQPLNEFNVTRGCHKILGPGLSGSVHNCNKVVFAAMIKGIPTHMTFAKHAPPPSTALFAAWGCSTALTIIHAFARHTYSLDPSQHAVAVEASDLANDPAGQPHYLLPLSIQGCYATIGTAGQIQHHPYRTTP